MKLTFVPRARDGEAPAEDMVISHGGEERRPIIAALSDVLGLPRESEAWETWHWCRAGGGAAPSTRRAEAPAKGSRVRGTAAL